MTDPIADAVRAGCAVMMGKGCYCPYPECDCDDYGDVRRALETAARHAHNAAIETAAEVAEHGLKWAEHKQVVAAIRALKIGDPT